MNKVLLMACAAMFSFNVNAQVKFTVPFTKNAVKLNSLKVENVNPRTFAKPTAQVAKVDNSGINGVWIMNDYNEEKDIYTCTADTITSVEVDGMNVKVQFGQNWVYGLYKDNVLDIPQQYINEGAVLGAVNSKVIFVGIQKDMEHLNPYGVKFILNDESALVLPDSLGGWYMVIESGDYANQGWDLGLQTELHRTNGTMTGVRSMNKEQTDVASPVYVVDEESSLTVYGLHPNIKMNIDIDKAAGTFTVPTPQNVAVTAPNQQQAGYGDYYRILGVNSDGYFDDKVKEVKGTYAENTLTFNEPKEGDLSGVYGIFTLFDAEGSGYTMGYYLNAKIFYQSVTGINDVTITSTKNVDNRIFNLAGQQVGNDYKGIVIKNGVKMVQK